MDNQDFLENHVFAEINIGDTASITKQITKKDIEIFAIISGDINPAHVDEEFAKNSMFQKIIAHGILTGSLISTVLGTKLPGPGAIYLNQSFKFLKPVAINDTITATVTVSQKEQEKSRIILDCVCTNQNNSKVLTGEAIVLAPKEKINRKKIILPTIELK